MRWIIQEIESPDKAPRDAFTTEVEAYTSVVVNVKGKGVLLITPIPDDALLLETKED